MAALDLIAQLRRHQRWVAVKLLDAARPLTHDQLHRSFPIGMGSLWETLVHLYAADFIWLAAIEGDANPIGPREVRFDSMAQLEAAWELLFERWTGLVSGLTEPDLARPIAKVSTSAGAGRMFVTPLSDVVLHLSTHAAHTAAQALNMLRQLGVKPPDVQLMTMVRMETAA